MAALKHQVDAALGRRLADELVAAWPAFPDRRFTRGLAAALEPLELLARFSELADRLARTLPAEFPAASAVLWRCLDSATFSGWMTVPCGTLVGRLGIDDPERALPLLAGLTPRWSSEWAIRPFIERRPALTYEHLRRWSTDDDEHVRRLVSEGTRPRLPWASRLPALVADPTPNLPLLDALADDPSGARSPTTSTTSPRTTPRSRSTSRAAGGHGRAPPGPHGMASARSSSSAIPGPSSSPAPRLTPTSG